MKKLTLIYASTTGNTEAVMDKVAEILKEHPIELDIFRSEEIDGSVVTANDNFILATSTWGHGIINPFFDELLDFISNNSMKGKRAGFIGLGDKAYEPELFNNGIKMLKAAFIKSGGVEIEKTFIIDGDPFPLLETKVPYWTEKFISALNNDQT
jgi:flavodoxin I